MLTACNIPARSQWIKMKQLKASLAHRIHVGRVSINSNSLMVCQKGRVDGLGARLRRQLHWDAWVRTLHLGRGWIQWNGVGFDVVTRLCPSLSIVTSFFPYLWHTHTQTQSVLSTLTSTHLISTDPPGYLLILSGTEQELACMWFEQIHAICSGCLSELWGHCVHVLNRWHI